MHTSPTLVLAYTGRPHASRAIGRLAARTGAEIVTVTLDLGQGADLEQASSEARSHGAVRGHVVDARETFASEVLLPALRAGATGAGLGVRAAALARPVVVKTLAEVARMEGAHLVAHGAAGPDRVAMDRLLADAAPDLQVVAIDEDDSVTAWPRVATNLWGRTVMLAADADPDGLAPGLYTRTAQPAACQAVPAAVDPTFERGLPVAVSGIPMPFVEIIEVIETIAGDHGIGRTMVRTGPDASLREIGEAPAAVTLALALAEIERATLDPRLAALKRQLAPAYAKIIDEGAWFSAARAALDARVASASSEISGVVRVLLFQGECRVPSLLSTGPGPAL